MKEEDAYTLWWISRTLLFNPMLGGLLPIDFFGNRNCILLGGLMMAVGQFYCHFSVCLEQICLS
jgi:POT family proton-dependent oligopeptide transporter